MKDQPMDNLHGVLSSLRGETKSEKNHLSVFREFLAHLDQLQRKAPSSKPSRVKAAVRSKPAKRARRG